MGRNGLLAFIRLDFKLRGFKAWILFLVSALGTPWDLLDQNLAAIVDLEEMVKVLECKVEVLERVYFRQQRGDVAHLVSNDSKEVLVISLEVK
ncbi:hypothetical protein Tco_0666808 [Tanacetum coccineum]